MFMNDEGDGDGDGDGDDQQQHQHRQKLDGFLTRTCRICSKPVSVNYRTRVDVDVDVDDVPDNISDKEDDTDAGILLFSEESKRLELLRKIRKYLYLKISLEDKLPKIMCKMCVRKLETFHLFASRAIKTQEKLNSLVNEETKSISQMNNNESRGLLHAYLTKGVIDIPKDESSSTEEMEVRLDPMLFLQYSTVDQTSEDTMRIESTNGYYDKDGLEIFKDKKADAMNLPKFSLTSQFRTCDGVDVIIDERKADACSPRDLSTEQSDLAPSAFQSLLYQDLNFTPRSVYTCNQCAITFPTELSLQSHNWHHITQSLTNNILKNDRQPESLPQSEPDTDDGSSEDGSLQDKDRGPLNLIARSYQLPFMPTANTIQTMLLSALNRGLERFCCPICGKRISTKGNLKVHLDTHRPKGKYGCDICGRVFKTQCNLLRHKEYHQGIQFPCIVCGRVYPTNSTLRAHSITHSDLRPHKCPLCDKTFKRNQDLKFHINQHTGARPYQCPYCPKAFASSGNCFSHRKRMHPEEVERDKKRAAKIMS